MKNYILVFLLFIFFTSANNSYSQLSGTVTVGATGSTYTSLSATGGLFNAIYTQGLSGNLTVIINNSEANETGTIALNKWAETGAGGYTLTIQPSAATAVTVSGFYNGTKGMIDFSGAGNVTIDGSFGTSNQYLTINNTAGGIASATIYFENDANNIVLKYCNISGSPLDCSSQQFGSGYCGSAPAYIFIGNGAKSGNNNITIDHNNIGSGNYIDQCIIANSTTVNNHDITISNNNIYNFMDDGYTTNDYGIYITQSGTGAGSNWNISGNSFYEDGVAGGAYSQEFIYFYPGSNSTGNTISLNYLGGNGPNCAAGTGYAPGYFANNACCSSSYVSNLIDVNCGSITISNNVIKNIRFTNVYAPLVLINITGSTVANVIGNQLGDATYQVSTAYYTITGIEYSGGASGCQFTNNTFKNLKSAGGNYSYNYGIYINYTAQMSGLIIQGNTIEIPWQTSSSNLMNSGIYINGTYNISGSVLSNRIYDTDASSGGDDCGIYLSVPGIYASCSLTVANNQIFLKNPQGSTSTALFGIWENCFDGTGSTINYFYNSVYITGTSASTYNSCVFYRASGGSGYPGPVIQVKDNLFISSRSGGTGAHNTISNRYGDANWASTSSDYNLLLNSTVASLGNWNGTNETYAAWKISSGGDSHSINPTYSTSASNYTTNTLDPANLFTSAATGNLNISLSDGQSYQFIYHNGLDLTSQGLTTDYNGNTRCPNPGCPGGAEYPDIGSDEFSACTSATISTEPSPASVCTGQNAGFSVTADGSGTLSYQWLLNSNTISGATTNNYQLSTTNESNAGSYSCIVSNNCGSATSNAAILTVNTTPLITGLTTNQTRCTGDTVSFKITATGSPSPSYQWLLNGEIINSATTNNYQLTTINESDSGSYTCIVSNSCNALTSGNVSLNVLRNPEINYALSTVTNQSVCVGSSITFTANATGYNLSYQWLQGGSDINGATNSLYSILNSQLSDNDVYSCNVYNECSSAGLPTFVLNIYTLPVLNVIPPINHIQIGDTISWTLNPMGGTYYAYQWLFDGNYIVGATLDNYSIKSFTEDDYGVYQCKITDTCGSNTFLIANFSPPVNPAISGNVIYDNLSQTPLSNVWVYLLNGEAKIDSSMTDSSGTYHMNTVPGTYTLNCSTKLSWGGANPLDALEVNRYFIGAFKITDPLKLLAADVNNDKKINPLDALLINRRFIGVIKHFTISDWLFLPISVTIQGVPVTQNISAICAGDVSGRDK